jgi:hypothetical protein
MTTTPPWNEAAPASFAAVFPHIVKAAVIRLKSSSSPGPPAPAFQDRSGFSGSEAHANASTEISNRSDSQEIPNNSLLTAEFVAIYRREDVPA